MILRSQRCVFFHIPKTAGYAIEQALLPGNRDYRVFDAEHLFGLKDGVMTQHLPYAGMLKFVPRATLDSCFKFAFTRNTWDRLVSAYAYLKPHHDRLYGGFEGWLRAACDSVREGRCAPTDHHAPQTLFLRHEGRDVLDFRGSYENLQADFDTVCSALGLPRRPLPRVNRSALRAGPFAAYYDSRTRALVAETYAEEISLLNCRFDS